MQNQTTDILITLIASTLSMVIVGGVLIMTIYRTQKKLQQKQSQSFLAILDAQEKEKERIARDLHDQVGPLLSGLKFKIDLVENSGALYQFKSESSVMIDTIIDDIRSVSYNLMPKVLYTFGLIDAIEDCCRFFAKSTDIKIEFENRIEGFVSIEEYKQIHVYRIVQEILNNSIKYSEASTVNVIISNFNKQLTIKISDDGIGFDKNEFSEKAESGMGLKNIFGRIKLIEANCELITGENVGTSYLLS